MVVFKKALLVSCAALVIGCSVIVLEHSRDHIHHDTDVVTSDDVVEQKQKSEPESSTSLVELYRRPAKKIEYSSNSSTGAFLAGRSASLNGDHKNAAKYLGKALEKEFSHSSVVSMALRHHLLSGDIDEALKIVAKLDPDVASKHRYSQLISMVQALKEDDIERARKHARSVKPMGLQVLYAPFLKAWFAYDATGDISPLDVAEKLGHGYYLSLQHYHEALKYALSGQDDKASSSYEAALDTLHEAPDEVFFAAVQFYTAQGDEARVTALLTEYRGIQQRAAMWQLRSDDDYVKEIADYPANRVTSVSDGVAETLTNIGVLLVYEGAHEEGQILLRLALYLRPDDSYARLILAESLEDGAEFDAAIAQYRAVSTPGFLKELTILRLARAYYSKDDIDAARDLLLAIRKSTLARYNLNVMLGDLERGDSAYDKAAEYYSRAINALPDVKATDWPLIYRRGIMYDMAGQWQKAETDFKRALELQPDEPEVLNYLGYSWLLRDERLDDAKKILRKAVDARPHNAYIVDSYGWALFKLGQYEEALDNLERALSIMPGDPTINDHYADVLWTVGRQQEAVFHWERALQFEPSEDGAQEAIQYKIKHGLSNDDTTTHHSDAHH